MNTYQIFGSATSLDLDICFFVDRIVSISESNTLLKQIIEATNLSDTKKINGNLGVISNGVLIDCFKGIPDELNNALIITYDLHKQAYANHVVTTVQRNIDLKLIRCARTLVSYFTRTELRVLAKKTLRDDFQAHIDFLKPIKLTQYPDFGKHGTPIEIYKSMAFQLGQTLALFDEIELYTKEAIAEVYPSIAPYLYREETPPEALQTLWDIYIEKAIVHAPKMKQTREYIPLSK
jgi:hypothetical protein